MLSGSRDRLAPPANAIALTFDDGPDPRTTPDILAALKESAAVATFFLVGEAAVAAPKLVEQIIDDGHAVGSHSWSHPDPWTLGFADLCDEYRRGTRAIEAIVGHRIRRFRPPKGFLNVAGAAAMRRTGLRPWLWTIDAGDWLPGARQVDIITRSAAMKARDVILLHDALRDQGRSLSTDRGETVRSLPEIVALARSRGLALVRLPE